MSNDASPPPPPTGEAIPVSPDRLRGHVQHLAASPRNGRYAPTGHLAARHRVHRQHGDRAAHQILDRCGRWRTTAS